MQIWSLYVVDLKINDNIIENINLVIFDRDGTLIDLYHYWSQMIAKRAELICNRFKLNEEDKTALMFAMGVDVKAGQLRSEGPVGIKKREIVMQAAVDQLAVWGIIDAGLVCFEIFKEVDQWSTDMLGELIKPLPGAKELIDVLLSRDCKIAIATTDREERAKISMDFLALTDKLDYIVGADSVKKSKPAPDMINLILKELKADKLAAVMVGDAETDIQMGNNAGLKACIAVCTGISSRSRLAELTELVVEDISKILVS
ncbi:hypothetical protein A2276_05995 [candidate division WOR-1 bacterium RIFOXYA12_FULL_43_27]|uniref:HAD family hydrolase n=1 Tax=candidate division WOR-1 bacterium RIFOXYC2_FULL_46_14 TaxID=1802587 RepID=A0A1F4U3B2_UNCSA|nr:MAG: hypothetical protein A2276_05995 [candidate division WOR-1 bacterium RIFOXYA12_FULL_43_27]OGC20210.1 MAG: hypothetical protein A2292_03995 [candidate division WOR-1 bacterium RIFOXYB2_FULL_46_45]OGC32052.1 MAG: hypothetical protein A2232_07450 [candidate division WOR-1 bacterium RIFOXYA2_FULL_46_56]OGC39454.1 MAG: hypothetical protein A2438_07815 [candidate division WOR-1 bacterium RIFOXYC2_FULL_46_14]